MFARKISRKRSFITLILIGLFFINPLQAQEEPEIRLKHGFLRDVMMPIGLPAVTFFHSMREHSFFNTAFQEAGAIESLGNFLLRPTRYLFCGKIARKNSRTQTWELAQEFHYKKWPRLNEALSLLTIPVALPLGAAVKSLAFLSPNVRMRHAELRNSQSNLTITSHLEEYQRQGISLVHSEEKAPCLHYTRPTKLTSHQQVEIKALQELTTLLDKHNIIYWIDFGTCLGSYRHGGRIPWDWDIDIAILLPDHDNVKRILSQLDPTRYSLQDWSCYSRPKSLFKLYVKETKNFIDIYHYAIDDVAQTISYYYTCMESSIPKRWQKRELTAIYPFAYEDIFPLVRAQFDGFWVWAPHNIVKYLQKEYGENLDPVMVWDKEQNCYIKIEEHPYWLTQNR